MPQENMQPVGLHFCNRVWRSLAKPRPDAPMQWRPAPEAVLLLYYHDIFYNYKDKSTIKVWHGSFINNKEKHIIKHSHKDSGHMSYSKIIIHFVFVTHLRGRTIYIEHEKELYAYILGIVKKLGARLIRIGGMPDHVHMITELPTKLSVAEFARIVKQSSSVWLKGNVNFPEWDGWADGYSAFSCSANELSRVVEYVREQKEHHKKVSLRDEYINFLNSMGIEYDEKYLPLH